jgi:hypothetical protein
MLTPKRRKIQDDYANDSTHHDLKSKKFLDKKSHACTISQLDLLQVPETQSATTGSTWTCVNPWNTLETNDTITFEYPGSGDNYLDLSKTFIIMDCAIVEADGNKAISENDSKQIGPVNLFFHSLFSQCKVKLGDKIITPSQNMYQYRAMFETLLNCSEDVKQSKLTGSLFVKDLCTSMDDTGETNTGLTKRRTWARVNGSKTFQMFGQLHSDIFFQDRYILNNMPLQIVLTRSLPTFCLMNGTAKTLKVLISKIQLYLREVELNPDVVIGHEMAMQKENAKYPIRRVEMKTLNIGRGTTDEEKIIASGTFPSRVVIGMVDADAFGGSYTKNPFNFQHFDLSSLRLTMNGRAHPFDGIDLDFGANATSSNKTAHGFYTLFSGIDKLDEGNFIDRDDYDKGYTLFAFDLSTDLCSGNHLDLVEKGNLGLRLNFKKLTVSINVVIYMEYQKMIEIDNRRNVIIDFGQ